MKKAEITVQLLASHAITTNSGIKIHVSKDTLEALVKLHGQQSVVNRLTVGALMPSSRDAQQYANQLKNNQQLWRP